MDLLSIRKDFPYLESSVNGKPPVYLDSAATTHKPVQVINTISEIYSRYNAPVNRSAYSSGSTASRLYFNAHENIARFIGAGSYREIILTKNSTEAINLAAYSLAQSCDDRYRLTRGDEVILPLTEHHSDYIPWLRLSGTHGIVIKNVSPDHEGFINCEKVRSMITDRTKLICCSHVSNVLGLINPVKELAEISKQAGIMFLVDGTQSVPHMPVNVQDIGCDFFVFSGHKMLAPAGTGVLWGRESILERIPPFLAGGGMIKSVNSKSAVWNTLPWKFEAGTPDMCGAVALAGGSDHAGGIRLYGAMDYLDRIGMVNVHSHEKLLCGYALDELRKIPEIIIYGSLSAENRCGIISFNIIKEGEFTDPHVAAELLSGEGIEVRAGGHCAYPLMDEFGISGTLRVSFYIYNTLDEVDLLIYSLKDIINNRLL